MKGIHEMGEAQIKKSLHSLTHCSDPCQLQKVSGWPRHFLDGPTTSTVGNQSAASLLSPSTVRICVGTVETQ
jgi:hypothetical protein